MSNYDTQSDTTFWDKLIDQRYPQRGRVMKCRFVEFGEKLSRAELKELVRLGYLAGWADRSQEKYKGDKKDG